MRSVLWTLSAVLGGVGVFCTILSFSVPFLGAHALLLLGSAIAINFCLDRC
jgi:hypothetical protein